MPKRENDTYRNNNKEIFYLPIGPFVYMDKLKNAGFALVAVEIDRQSLYQLARGTTASNGR